MQKKAGKVNRTKNRGQMETNTKMIGLNPALPMVTLNVDDLNTPV